MTEPNEQPSPSAMVGRICNQAIRDLQADLEAAFCPKVFRDAVRTAMQRQRGVLCEAVEAMIGEDDA